MISSVFAHYLAKDFHKVYVAKIVKDWEKK